MLKAKVIIIEDEFFAAAHLKELVTKLDFWVVGVYHSGEDFLKETDWNFDAAIVDIFLSGKLTGLDIAPKIKAHKKPFVFLTANRDSQTLKEAARLSPAAYISKPFQPNDVTAALEIITHQLPKMLKVRTNKGIELINPNDVIFIQSDGVYIEIHTRKTTIVQRKLLKEMEEELPDFFIRVHRSYLVNSAYIEKKTANSVTLNGYEIPVSRSFKEILSVLL